MTNIALATSRLKEYDPAMDMTLEIKFAVSNGNATVSINIDDDLERLSSMWEHLSDLLFLGEEQLGLILARICMEREIETKEFSFPVILKNMLSKAAKSEDPKELARILGKVLHNNIWEEQ